MKNKSKYLQVIIINFLNLCIWKMNWKFKIIKNAYVWVIWAVLLMFLSRLLFFSTSRYSEEFTGWVGLVIADQGQDTDIMVDTIKNKLQEIGYTETEIYIDKEADTLKLKIHSQVDTDEKVAELSQKVQEYLSTSNYITNDDDILEQTITGPSIGSYMQKSAIKALIAGVIFIVIYMLFSFAGIRAYISPGLLAIVTITTMIFDISIPAGAYGLAMYFDPTLQVNTIFIVAILTCMWYSINDTIIIFDRIRENMKKEKDSQHVIYGKVFEKSLWQTMRRSIGTSISTLLVVVAMFIFGTGVIQSFAFTIGVGVIAWSFSSIFLAAPLTYILIWKYKKEKSKL